MSTQVNTDLLERAKEMADYWVGTPIQRVIDEYIKTNELDLLRKTVIEAEALASQEEFYGYDLV